MSAQWLTLSAPAKVNLYLKITGRRSDGYHELDTLMQKLALYDRVKLRKTAKPGISLSCPDSDLAGDRSNIAYRAAELFLARCNVPHGGVEIVLQKNIPMAAGLGGGSSDAAAVLLGLERLFATGCSRGDLARIGLELGADVPFFVHDLPAARCTGIGEEIQPAAPLADHVVLLVNPSIAVSTKWAYETFALTVGKNIFNLSSSPNKNQGQGSRNSRLSNPGQACELYNDLEQVSVEKYPEIAQIKNDLLAGGAAGALMSGSGSTVFGLFAADCLQKAEQCRQAFSGKYEQVYLVDPLH